MQISIWSQRVLLVLSRHALTLSLWVAFACLPGLSAGQISGTVEYDSQDEPLRTELRVPGQFSDSVSLGADILFPDPGPGLWECWVIGESSSFRFDLGPVDGMVRMPPLDVGRPGDGWLEVPRLPDPTVSIRFEEDDEPLRHATVQCDLGTGYQACVVTDDDGLALVPSAAQIRVRSSDGRNGWQGVAHANHVSYSIEQLPFVESIILAEDGSPVPGAIVWASEAPAFWEISDRAGSAQLPIWPTNRSKRIRTKAEGFVGAEQTIQTDGSSAFVLQRGRMLRGIVVDGLGDAVQDAKVTLGGASAAPWRTRPLVAYSDSLGAFEFPGVTLSDPAYLVVSHDHYATTTELVTDHENGSQVVTLEQGSSLTGTVLLPGGEPAVGALVRSRGDAADLPTTTTGPRGRFRLSGIPRAGRHLEISAPFFEEVHLAIPHPIQHEELEPVYLEPRDPMTFRVLDHQGDGLAGVKLFCRDQEVVSTSELQGFSPDAISDSEGWLHLPRPRGRLISLVRDDVVPILDLPLDQVPDAGVVTMAPASAIEGRVLAAGEAVEGALVTATSRSFQRVSTFSDSNGAFRVAPLAHRAGPWTVVAEHESGTASLEVVGGTTGVKMELQSPGGLSGHVFDPRSHPIAGVRIRLDRPGDPGDLVRSLTSDPQGYFDTTELHAGTWRIRVTHPDYELEERHVDLVPGQRVELRFDLTDEGMVLLEGEVHDDTGRPVSGAEVSLWSQGTLQRRTTSSDADGTFSLRVPDEEGQVVACKEGHACSNVVYRADTPSVPLYIELKRLATVRGDLADPAGATIVGHSADGHRRTVVPTLDGAWELTGIEPGQWRFWVARAGQTHQPVVVEILSGQEHNVGRLDLIGLDR